MDKKVYLMCGPSQIPERVMNAMNKQVMSHRTDEYLEMHQKIEKNLKKVFQTKNDVIILTSSGTGAMEAAVQNCFSPGDKVVAIINGFFGEQFASIAESYGLDVTKVSFDLGEAADVKTVMNHVEDDTKGVLIIHNESTTGITNNLKDFGNALKNTNTLLIADSISGLGGIELKMDEWNVDVVLTGSQKALMTPPGLAFISLSDKAWEAVEKSTSYKYYFNLIKAKEYNKGNMTVFTCPVSIMYGLEEALEMLIEEGLENVYKRHSNNANLVRKGVLELGLELYPKDINYASSTLTAVSAPGEAKRIVQDLAKEGVIVGGGLPPITEDTFRVGTMGYVSENDIAAFLYSLKKIL